METRINFLYMKLFCLLFSMFFFINNSFTQVKLPEIRQLYLESVESKVKSDEFLKMTKTMNQNDALYHGYYATAVALVSKHTSAPTEKLKYIRMADKLFEEAIMKNPENAEIRFLRFSVQVNIPKFLGFSNDINDDKKKIIQNVKNEKSLQDYPEWLNIIIKFMIDSGYCSIEEKTKLILILR